MSAYIIDLTATVSFCLACLLLGYRMGISKGLRQRRHLHIIHNDPKVQGQRVRTKKEPASVS
jgi:hypothetical protein